MLQDDHGVWGLCNYCMVYGDCGFMVNYLY